MEGAPPDPAEQVVPPGQDGPGGDTPADDKCPDDPCVMMPRSVLIVAVLWTVLLVAAFVTYEQIGAVQSFFPKRLGPLPFTSIWFGAVGGLLISLEGIFTYNRRWRRSYDYWHYLRPVLGGFIGTLGCLLFIVLNDAATTQQPKANGAFYAVVALVIGYREESFRILVKKIIDTLILPSDKPTDGTSGGSTGGNTQAGQGQTGPQTP